MPSIRYPSFSLALLARPRSSAPLRRPRCSARAFRLSARLRFGCSAPCGGLASPLASLAQSRLGLGRPAPGPFLRFRPFGLAPSLGGPSRSALARGPRLPRVRPASWASPRAPLWSLLLPTSALAGIGSLGGPGLPVWGALAFGCSPRGFLPAPLRSLSLRAGIQGATVINGTRRPPPAIYNRTDYDTAYTATSLRSDHALRASPRFI